MKLNIGIDASRNRSGGAKAHIIGILNDFDEKFLVDEIEKVHVWSYQELLDFLPDKPWLVKHSPKELKKSIIHQLWWQYKSLPREAKSNNIDILLNTDAGTVCPYLPSITMSRDMLSYEKGEMDRYKFGLAKIRLWLLRYMQNRSLRKASAAIFLTQYAADMIQEYSGKIRKYKVIPHGVSDNFRINNKIQLKENLREDNINCVYISNVDFYKHQWNVALAIEELNKRGYNVNCKFVGGGTGEAQQKFEQTVGKIKDAKKIIKQIEFVAHKDVPNFLQQADIFIFASSCENMPNTLVEGMCTGLPIACSKRGPMPEVLKDGGVYFDPENIDSIVNALEVVINDSELRKKISTISVNLSEQYNWKRCSRETFEYLCETIRVINNIN